MEAFIQENQIFVGILVLTAIGVVGAFYSLGGLELFKGGSNDKWYSDWGDWDSDFGDWD